MAAKRIVIVGAGGHGKVVADVAALAGWTVAGAVDRSPSGGPALASGLKILGGDDALPGLKAKGVKAAAVGVGGVQDTGPRRAVRLKLAALGFSLPALKHPSAIVARGVPLGDGAQVMAGVVINPGASVGEGVVVNTGAIVEHDCTLEDDCFVGPGAVLGGDVSVGAGAFIGLGATVLPGVALGPGCVVGAGAVVVEDVPQKAVVAGVPARSR